MKFQDVPSHRVGVVQDCYSCSHTSICMFNGFGSKQVPHVLVHHKCRSLSVETESGDLAGRLGGATTLESDWNGILV